MYKDYFLRCESAETMRAKLLEAGVLVPTDGDLHPADGINIDYVGKVHRSGDQTGEDGFPIIEVVQGYHVNLRGRLRADQEERLPIIDKPNNPARIFAL